MDNELNKCGEGCGCGHDHDSHGCGDNCGCGEHEHEHFVVDLEDDIKYLTQEKINNPEDESVYLFRSTEEGELIVPEEAEFDKVTEYYTNVLADE